MSERSDDAEPVVCVATDANFALPTAVTLRSAALSSRHPIRFVVLHEGIDPVLRNRIGRSVPVEGTSIQWVDMTGRDVAASDRMHLPGAANFRLLIDQLDVDWPERLLYIDVDTVVRRDLGCLWEIDLGDKIVAAVRSVNYPSICTYGAVDHWPRLGLDPRQPFFNSGVLLIDMERWREHQIGAQTLAFLASPDAASPNADQEALNVCLAGRWLELDPEWNQQRPIHEENRGVHRMYDDIQIERARRDPAIVHFSDRPKPWHRDCRHPWREDWLEIAAQTQFAPVELDKTSLTSVIRWRLKRAASALIKGR